ncbi:Rieske (2Fe-2S) protein [Gryllotalpicola protaetiae]|uniref:Cytochrome bc1 complex Rieske iron-sulfur subunit n=1 Tax=Gryllotalpicola protaetiae TaxID=2419771 RepID=A0A387BWN0_9MICO|nr:Rieske (2Fe-2S) protein [Gryllotalpicola protaetiae]
MTRRTALATAGAGVVSLGLAACSPTNGQAPGDNGSGDGVKATKDASGKTSVAASSIPVGGSIIVQTGSQSDPAIALAQPSSGKFVAHTAVCTHQGCIVAAAGAELHCPCHGSKFDAFTGKAIHGPASLPLDEVAVTVSGSSVEFDA